MCQCAKCKIKQTDMNYYIYANRLLGVETNAPSFRWIYGKKAPVADREAFEACKVRFFVNVTSDKNIPMPVSKMERFQCYSWSGSQKILSYNRKMVGRHMAYSISIQGNEVHALLGKNYYRFVRHRCMNLHSAYYLLSDLANILLLKNGYATLYCAAALHRERGRGLALFAAPNTGKSFTVKRLCETGAYALIAEDIAIVDEEGRITGCPWTNTYRETGLRQQLELDGGGAFARRHNYTLEYEIASGQNCLSDMILLSRAQDRHEADSAEIEKKILILNKYLFCGYNTPIVNILAFFDNEFNCDWECIEKQILQQVFSKCRTVEISLSNGDFFPIVMSKIDGDNM